MDRTEALKTLGVPSTATPLEIKKAHRDLAKVWHPDRFGTDPHLRHKAEETLKGINEAYQLLRSGATPRLTRPAPPPPGRTSPLNPPSPRQAPPRKTRAQQTTRPSTVPRPNSPFWSSKAFLLSVGLGFIWIASSLSSPKETALPESAATVPARTTAGSVRAPFDGDKPAIENPLAKTQEGTLNSSPTKPLILDWEPPPYTPLQIATAPSTGARVTLSEERRLSEISEPERQSIEAVCTSAKYLEGVAAYNRCLQRQLAQLGSASSRPELSGLTRPEQDSIEAVCSRAKYLEGPVAYNRCLRTQLAQLRSAPSRPDLSGFSQPEQQSIEATCSRAKYLEGPAAYNRCLVAQLRSMKGRD